jgi:hypothetical protein
MNPPAEADRVDATLARLLISRYPALAAASGAQSSFDAWWQPAYCRIGRMASTGGQRVIRKGNTPVRRGTETRLASGARGVQLPWSNGDTEGQVDRLKLLKRQMHGRASFDPLRRRV